MSKFAQRLIAENEARRQKCTHISNPESSAQRLPNFLDSSSSEENVSARCDEKGSSARRGGKKPVIGLEVGGIMDALKAKAKLDVDAKIKDKLKLEEIKKAIA